MRALSSLWEGWEWREMHFTSDSQGAWKKPGDKNDIAMATKFPSPQRSWKATVRAVARLKDHDGVLYEGGLLPLKMLAPACVPSHLRNLGYTRRTHGNLLLL